MKKVLIMEYESNIRSFMLISLQRAGYEVVEVATGDHALDRIRKDPDIAVAILDSVGPGVNGAEVCRRIRTGGRNIRVIMLVPRLSSLDRPTEPISQADDQLVKPFSPVELTEMVHSQFRRLTQAEVMESDLLRSGPFVMNIRNHTLDRDNVRIRLTKSEYGLMKLLLSNPGKSVRRQILLECIWEGQRNDAQIVDATVGRLRAKIEEDAAHPKYICTVQDGYRWSI